MVNFLCSGSQYCRADQGPAIVQICPKQRDRSLPTNNLPIIHLLPYQTTSSPYPISYQTLGSLPTSKLPTKAQPPNQPTTSLPTPNIYTPPPPDAGLLYRVRDPQFQTGPTRQVSRPQFDMAIFSALFSTFPRTGSTVPTPRRRRSTPTSGPA